jgi:DnaK suppressor protein
MTARKSSFVEIDATVREPDLSFAHDARQWLLSEKKQLVAKMASEPHSSETPAAGEQEADYPAEDEIREVEFRHHEMHHLRLLRLNDALERIDNGRFGFCLQCNAKISEYRLQADPAVERCVVCQSEVENMRRVPLL